MGTILKLKNTTLPLDDTSSMMGPRVRLGTLPRTLAVFDFKSQISSSDVAAGSAIPSMLPDQSGVSVSGAFADAVASKGLKLTSSTSGETALLPDAFKLNWETDPSYMLSFWYTNIAPVSATQFAPFIGWCNTTSDLKWAFGPWGTAANCTVVLEGASVDYGAMATSAGLPQLVTAFVKRTGSGVCAINFYKNGNLLSALSGISYRTNPTATAGQPRIGKMPSLSGVYSGVVHSCQVAKIPATGIADEAGWVAQEYANHAARYAV